MADENIYSFEDIHTLDSLDSYFCVDLARQRVKYRDKHGTDAPDSELALKIGTLDKPYGQNFFYILSH